MGIAAELPDVLRAPLVFGNSDQIAALREYEAKVGDGEAGELGEWWVDVEVSLLRQIKVTARSKSEAEGKVMDMSARFVQEAEVDVFARRAA